MEAGTSAASPSEPPSAAAAAAAAAAASSPAQRERERDTISLDEFRRLQQQLLELKAANYALEERCVKLQQDNVSFGSQAGKFFHRLTPKKLQQQQQQLLQMDTEPMQQNESSLQAEISSLRGQLSSLKTAYEQVVSEKEKMVEQAEELYKEQETALRTTLKEYYEQTQAEKEKERERQQQQQQQQHDDDHEHEAPPAAAAAASFDRLLAAIKDKVTPEALKAFLDERKREKQCTTETDTAEEASEEESAPPATVTDTQEEDTVSWVLEGLYALLTEHLQTEMQQTEREAPQPPQLHPARASTDTTLQMSESEGGGVSDEASETQKRFLTKIQRQQMELDTLRETVDRQTLQIQQLTMQVTEYKTSEGHNVAQKLEDLRTREAALEKQRTMLMQRLEEQSSAAKQAYEMKCAIQDLAQRLKERETQNTQLRDELLALRAEQSRMREEQILQHQEPRQPPAAAAAAGGERSPSASDTSIDQQAVGPSDLSDMDISVQESLSGGEERERSQREREEPLSPSPAALAPPPPPPPPPPTDSVEAAVAPPLTERGREREREGGLCVCVSVCQLRLELDELKIEKAISERRARQATHPPSLRPSLSRSLSLSVCVCWVLQAGAERDEGAAQDGEGPQEQSRPRVPASVGAGDGQPAALPVHRRRHRRG